MTSILAASILGGFLAVEHRSSLRLMVSQPLVGGLLTGILLGAPLQGFIAGAFFQILFLGHIQMRGERSPDLPSGGVAAAALYILVSRDSGGAPPVDGDIMVWSMLIAILVAGLGMYFHAAWCSRSAGLADRALDHARGGRFREASSIHLSMLAVHFLYGFAVIFAALTAGRPLAAWAAGKPGLIDAGPPGLILLLIPFVGIGSILRIHLAKSHAFWLASGFLLTGIAVMVWR